MAWSFIAPVTGWRAWGVAEGELRVFDGAGWVLPPASSQNLAGLGVATSWDATNRLAVASEAVLLTHAGAGHQLKINKATAGDTASLLFQSGWSGRAEMGPAGDDDFHLKVSADGSAWTEAMVIDAATGSAAFRPGLGIDGNAAFHIGNAVPSLYASRSGTANAIALATGLGLGSLPAGLQLRFRAAAANTGAVTINVDGLGAVAAHPVGGAGALPAGYIRTDVDTVATYDGSAFIVDRAVERGSNANGTFVRFADGTQICERSVAHDLNDSAPQGWAVPAAFVASGFVGTGNVDGSTPADAADWYAREGSVWGGTSGWTSRAAGGTASPGR